MEKHLFPENDKPSIYLQQNIRLMRKRLKLSQEELARQIGLNRGNIASYENGTAEPKICNLLKFARLFRIPVHKLTYSDLSSDQKLDDSPHSIDQHLIGSEETLDKWNQQLDRTEELMRSIRTCCHFRKESQDNLSPDLQAFMVHFDELYRVAEQLVCDQRAMLKNNNGSNSQRF